MRYEVTGCGEGTACTGEVPAATVAVYTGIVVWVSVVAGSAGVAGVSTGVSLRRGSIQCRTALLHARRTYVKGHTKWR